MPSLRNCGLLSAILSLLLATPLPAATTRPTTRQAAIPVTVDPRVELISIIYRLAGNNEYLHGMVPAYTRDVDQHFQPFRDHPVVRLARQLRDTRSICFDAPMSLVPHISPPPALEELIPLDPLPDTLDSRWQTEDVRAFLREARDFARKTNFPAFFDAHKPLYEQAAQRMGDSLARHAHLDWFDRFFGPRPNTRFHLVLGMLNGGGCYGTRIGTDKGDDLYFILGVWQCDRNDIPTFPADVIPIVIHEFAHSYVNPIVDRHQVALKPAGRKLFAKVRQAMQRQAYGSWDTMMRESMVRACVVRYRVANDGVMASLSEIAQQHLRSFSWTGDLSTLLADYEQHRDKYPTLDAFMPRVIDFFDSYASRDTHSQP